MDKNNFFQFIEYTDVYDKDCSDAIKNEFSRLEKHCYLDHAGTTLYSETQLENVFKDLKENVFGNPHSGSTMSKLTGDLVDQARYNVLEFFNARPSEYSVIFTSGATASLKAVAETFHYGSKGTTGSLLYLEDNHTSALGMRSLAPKCQCIQYEVAFKTLANSQESKTTGNNISIWENEDINSLFVYPAQCNYSGTKYPLSWIEKVHKGYLNKIASIKATNWYCFLDAASFVASNPLDLQTYQPDFVAVSFYKIFGYPTGLGALLVKNSSAHVLKKRYYGGGAVSMAISSEYASVPKNVLHERFEDGTEPFLEILALRHGMETIKRLSLNMQLISKHVFGLAQYVYRCLKSLKHENGAQAVVLYHDTKFEDVATQGGIVNFNLKREDGSYIGYAEVMHIANLHDIQLRTGCLCNPGACQRHLKLTPKEVKFHFEAGHVCGDQYDIINGLPTGSVRISFGYMTTKENADAFLKLVIDYFILKSKFCKIPPRKLSSKNHVNSDYSHSQTFDETGKTCSGILEDIFIYPIKSCAAYSVQEEWDLVETGLKYDREWMIVTENGVSYSQKHDTKLCFLKPVVNISKNVLELHFPNMESITVSLAEPENKATVSQSLCHSKVCGDRIEAWDCGQEISSWLSKAFSKSGLRLLRMCTHTENSRISTKKDTKTKLSLVNKAQFLLINKASVEFLLESMPSEEFGTLEDLINRFRANFVVNIRKPFIEINLKQLKIANNSFKVEGPCARCHIICINQSSGEKTKEPLKTISEQMNGKLMFGMYLSIEPNSNSSKAVVGQVIMADLI